jgi:hypothetical protein
LLSSAVFAQKPLNDLPQPYKTSRDWGHPPNGAPWAAVTAIEVAKDGSVFVIHRCKDNSCAGRPEPPILKFDPTGKLLKAWGENMFVFPHGATIDPDSNLWVTDLRAENGKGSRVFKFSPEGKLLMTLGNAGVVSAEPGLFDEPTDVVVNGRGEIFISEGHSGGTKGNDRISVFDKNGKFLRSWGSTGSGPENLHSPHTLAFDSRGRLFVGDRDNNRIQIFDQQGKLLDSWKQWSRPSGIFIAPDDTMYVADSESWGPDNPGWKKGIRIGSARDGIPREFIEDMQSTTLEHSGAEGVGVDQAGNVYGGVARRQMLERHTRK